MKKNEELQGISLMDQQRARLKEVGLEDAIVGEIAGMWVLEGSVYLMDTRESAKHSKFKMRVILGNDIDIPYKPEIFADHYDFPVDTPTLALSDIVHTALLRLTGVRGYTSPTPSLEENYEIIREIIDRSKKSGDASPSVTLVTVEGSIWEDKHTFQPDPHNSFYTEQLLEKMRDEYKSEDRPLVLLAACNQKEQDGQVIHATITPPKELDLVYTQGLASILHGSGALQYVKGSEA